MRIPRAKTIGLVCISVALIVGLYRGVSNANTRLLNEAREKAQRATALYEESHKDYCSVYLAHLSDCIGGSKKHCTIAEQIKTEYKKEFAEEAEDDCIPKQDATPPALAAVAPIASDQPLFADPQYFDDSLGQ